MNKSNARLKPPPPQDNFRDRLVEAYGDDELLFLDPPALDIAIVGVGSRLGLCPVLIYDRELLTQAYVKEGMTVEEADEWIGFNVEGAYIGERTPIIMASARSLTSR